MHACQSSTGHCEIILVDRAAVRKSILPCRAQQALLWLPFPAGGLYLPVLGLSNWLMSLMRDTWLGGSVPLLSWSLRTVSWFCCGVFPFSLVMSNVPGGEPFLQPGFWKADDTEWSSCWPEMDTEQEQEINHYCQKCLTFLKGATAAELNLSRMTCW